MKFGIEGSDCFPKPCDKCLLISYHSLTRAYYRSCTKRKKTSDTSLVDLSIAGGVRARKEFKNITLNIHFVDH